MTPDTGPDIVRTAPVGDEVRFANVVRLEYCDDPKYVGWLARIGPDQARGLTEWGETPVRSLLNLCARIREDGWIFDPSYLDTSRIEHSPNVIVVRSLGPEGWRGWYATSFGAQPRSRSFCDGDPATALAGWTLRMRENRHVLDAGFRFADFEKVTG
jgi:hypothetical protein